MVLLHDDSSVLMADPGVNVDPIAAAAAVDSLLLLPSSSKKEAPVDLIVEGVIPKLPSPVKLFAKLSG